jgi:hypothetical protein
MIDWKKVSMHALYVGGTTLVATVASCYASNGLQWEELQTIAVPTLIAFGTAFMAAWGLQQGEPQPVGKKCDDGHNCPTSKGVARFIFLR